ncbi:hypothetical protein WMY93_015482 [Mugilogobius chulae]|uniref:PID domain-containing protein n=1 Tax=Mugilogobius chulae TaxID=88201 RepID=A0AAW0P1K9_9GOBI
MVACGSSVRIHSITFNNIKCRLWSVVNDSCQPLESGQQHQCELEQRYLCVQELPENWTDTKETLLEGMVFNVKYLGMTLVGQPKGEDMASAAIHRIVATARASAKKFRKVTLTVSPKGIVITDTETADLIENVSIYRISYCTADKTQDKVFAYVSQSQFNETLECHAFLCQKRKIAQAVTLTVAQAFKVALDLWEIAQEDKNKKSGTCPCSCSSSNSQTETTESAAEAEAEHKPVQTEEKVRRPFLAALLHSPLPRSNPTRRRPIKHDSWDVDDGLEDAFSSNMEVEETDSDCPSPNRALTMQL